MKLQDKKIDHYSVVCHNGRAAISGKFTQVSDSGCEILDEGDSASPVFALRAPILLNILDSKKSKTMNVQALTAEVRRQHGGWVYRILWSKTPEIFKSAPRKPRARKES